MQITIEETNQLINNKIEQVGKEFGENAKLLVKEIVILLNNLQREKPTRYIPVSEWGKYHDYPTVSAMRNYIVKSETNGFDKVFFKKGDRVIIDEAKFFEWLKRGNNDR